MASARHTQLFVNIFDPVVWGNGRFVAVAFGGATVATSTDGAQWTVASSTAGFLNRLLWVQDRFYGVGSNGRIATSTDGVAWTQVRPGLADTLVGLAWNGTELVATGAMGMILTSRDGSEPWRSRRQRRRRRGGRRAAALIGRAVCRAAIPGLEGAAEGPEESTAPEGDVGDTTDKTPNPEDGGIDTPASRAAMARFQAAFGARAQQRTAGRESLIDPGSDGGTAGGDAEQLCTDFLPNPTRSVHSATNSTT